MADAKDGMTYNEQRMAALSRSACDFIEKSVQSRIGAEALAEPAGQQWLWSECRLVFKQALNAWQDFTYITQTVAADGAGIGWLVEKRKENCLLEVLSDDEINDCVSQLEEIRLDMKLQDVERLPIDAQRSFAVAHYAGKKPEEALEVFVNPSNGEILGMLPALGDELESVPLDDARAIDEMELAWQRVEKELANRVGPDVAEEARQILKLEPLSAVCDGFGRRTCLYRLWGFFSTCSITIAEKSEEVVGWYIEAFQAEAPKCRLEAEKAAKIAGADVITPSGACGPSVEFGELMGEENATVHWWHEEQGVHVEGDHITVMLNAWDGKVFSMARKWRAIPSELLEMPGISAENAVDIANREMKRDPSQQQGVIIGKSLIEVAKDTEQPSPVRDVLVWRVGYVIPESAGFTEVAVDTHSREIVRITGW